MNFNDILGAANFNTPIDQRINPIIQLLDLYKHYVGE